MASSHLGFGPQQTMKLAERLYLGGYITYPRTESTTYASNFDFKATIFRLKRVTGLIDYAKNLLQEVLLFFY